MRVRAFSSYAGLLLAFARPSLADTQLPAVWYRASEGCPGGAQFLETLAESSRQARLAQAGDHIDFVVTLLTDSKGTVGRLERQTDSGTVAIRELRDATCERVADALALSLGLALAPRQRAAEPKVEKSASDPWGLIDESSTTVEASPPPAPPPVQPPAGRPPAPVADPRHTTVPTVAAEHPHSVGRQWAMGLGFGPMIGISTQPMPRGELFIDSRPALSHVLPNLSLRAGVIAAWGSSETAIGPVRRWILAGRAEGCPVAWRAGRVDLRPCAAFELGATGASAEGEAGVDDRSLWAAPAAQLRLAVALEPHWLWLEASGGALVPLIRNEIFFGSQSLYRDAPAVFHAGIGLSVRLP
jgi:hypothetical protein